LNLPGGFSNASNGRAKVVTSTQQRHARNSENIIPRNMNILQIDIHSANEKLVDC
jgi:hypothetical protein